MDATDLIAQFYESIGDSEALANTLMQLTHATRSRGTQLGVVDKTGSWNIGVVVGLAPWMLPAYIEHFAADDPRMAYSNRNPGRLAACHQIVGDETEFERSALVNELLEKNEARFAMAAMIPIDLSHSAILCLMRARRDGQYADDELDRVARLLPHIQRAVALHVRLGRLESRLTSLNALVDGLSAPVFLVDRTGLLRFANAAGNRALRQADFLTLRNGRVEPRNARQEKQYEEVLLAAVSIGLSMEHVEPCGAFRLLDPQGHSAVLVVQALNGQAALNGMPQAEIILFLTHSADNPPVSALRLQIVFSLTPAETRLAEHLMQGESLTRIAERLRLSRETLKTQLRSLFDKTGTHRQSELVALLISCLSLSIAEP
jgi:DNA-binding CsgD family transcriptional regulator